MVYQCDRITEGMAFYCVIDMLLKLPQININASCELKLVLYITQLVFRIARTIHNWFTCEATQKMFPKITDKISETNPSFYVK